MSVSMYTVREVATVLGVKPSRLRGYLRAGLISPQRGERGELRFSFQDLVLLRKAEGLVGSRIAPRRVHDALLRTRAHLGDGVPLSRVQFEADGQSIVASDGTQRWEPSSGQVLFQFTPTGGEPQGEMHELRQPKAAAPPPSPEGLTAEQHYERGYAYEEAGNDASAIEEYRRALQKDAAHADAHVNLGRLLHESGKPFEALEHYRAALTTRPQDGTAAFNLGVALEDLNRTDEAISAYQSSIDVDPSNADAHYNVARLFEQSGNSESAIRHLLIYRQLTRKRR
ncbi:MAG TPA: tetratricopeptide repeat protein [Polyangia bacterium]